MRLLGAVVSAFVFASSAHAATYFVATTGSDSASGSVTAPFRTIKQASRVVKPGDDVVVRGGVYPEATSISSKGTASARIVFRTYPGEHVILDGSNLAAGTDLLTLNGAQYVDIAGFEIRNSPKSGLVLWHVTGARVLDNHIHHTYLNGIYVGGSSTPSCYDITISGNVVHDTALENQYHTRTSGGWPGAVVVSRTDGAAITRNRIYNNDGEGLISLRSNSHLVEGNEISDNYSMNLYVDNARFVVANANLIHSSNPRYFRNGKPAAGIGVANETKDVQLPSSDNTFTNNIVVGTRWGFYYGNYEAGGGLKNTRVVNNTFYGTVDAIIHVDASTHSNSFVQNNIFHPTTSAAPTSTGAGAGVSYANNLWYGGNAGAAAGAGDVIANPLFANAGGRTSADYRIGAASGALAKALDASTLVQRDHFGTARITPFDIGAHQLSGGTPADTHAPSTPGNLRATGGDNTSVTLTWDAATDNVGISGYSIVRNGATVAMISGTTWTDRAVTANTVYLYQVIAHDAAGNRSAPSVTLHLAWRSSEVETTPAAPVVTSPRRTATTVSLQWNVVEHATSFKVYRDGVEIATTPWFDFTDRNLAPSTVYTYTIVAVDAKGNLSPVSNSVSVKTNAAGKSRASRH